MKKRLSISLVTVVVLSLCVSGCGGCSKEAEDTSSSPVASAVEATPEPVEEEPEIQLEKPTEAPKPKTEDKTEKVEESEKTEEPKTEVKSDTKPENKTETKKTENKTTDKSSNTGTAKKDTKTAEPEPTIPTPTQEETPVIIEPSSGGSDIILDSGSSSGGSNDEILIDSGSSSSSGSDLEISSGGGNSSPNSSSGGWDYVSYGYSLGASSVQIADDSLSVFYIFDGGNFFVEFSTNLAGTSDSLIAIGYMSSGSSVRTYDANYIVPYGDKMPITNGLYASSTAVNLVPKVVSYLRSNGGNVSTMPPSSLIGFPWENW